MSSKLSTQSSGGRRTPLALSPSSGQKSTQKTSLSESSNSLDSTTSTEIKNKKSDEKLKNDTSTKNSAKDNATNNGVENDKEKTSKKDASVTSHENGHMDNKEEKSITQKEDNLKKSDKKINRSSLRQSESLTKSDSKPEQTPEKKDTQKKIINEENPKEKSKKKEHTESKKSSTEDVSQPIKRSSRSTAVAQQTKQESSLTVGSLILQPEIHSFEDSVGHDADMESLLLDVDVSESATEIPTAARTINESHSNKFSPIKKSINKEEFQEKQEKRLTPLSRSTYSCRETRLLPPPSKLPAVDSPVTSTPDGPIFYSLPPSSLRQISGRRSLRPLKEYHFQYNSNYRETYRQIDSELDCTNNTSMNVTVGSEAPAKNLSFISSFLSFGRGKKRAHTPPLETTTTKTKTDDIQDDAVNTNTISPKRPRLDFSGFFGFVASPVTMLKNRLQRTNIDSSTPNNKTEDVNDAELDVDDDVSEIVENKEHDVQKQQDPINAEAKGTQKHGDKKENEPIAINAIEKEKNIEHLSKTEIGEEVFSDSNETDIEVVVNTNVSRRERCNIM